MPSRDQNQLRGRYSRIEEQMRELFEKTPDPIARMATAAAVLAHKMPHFFWVGFYRIVGDDLIVGPYQGPVACQVLARGNGVCWAAVQRSAVVLVPDVHAFPGHIACDSRSKSEVVAPMRDGTGAVRGVLDVDSDEFDAFGEADAECLARIADLIHA